MVTTTKAGKRVGRPPSCECDACDRCRRRKAAREAYQRKSAAERRAVVEGRDPETARANDRARYHRQRDERQAAHRAYMQTPEGKAAAAAAKKRWAEGNPEKRVAAAAINNALRDGRLVKGPCAEAGPDCRGRIEGHHEDYTQPMVVRWLCAGVHHPAADEARRARETQD